MAVLMDCPCKSTVLANIAKDCCSNIGGVRRVFLALYDDANPVFTAFDEESGQVTGISSTATWYSYEFRPNSASLSTEFTTDGGANFATSTLTMSFNRMDNRKRVAVAALAASDLVGLVEDNNGFVWALGTYNPLTNSNSSGETGAEKSDVNQYTIVLSSETPNFLYAVSDEAYKSIKKAVV